jgi:hypothetical protein
MYMLIYLKGYRRKCSHTYHRECLSLKHRPQEDDVDWQCRSCAKKGNINKPDSEDDDDGEDDDDDDEVSSFLAAPSPVKKNRKQHNESGKPESFTAAKRLEDARLKILKISDNNKKRNNLRKSKLCAGNTDEDKDNMELNPTLLNSHEGIVSL